MWAQILNAIIGIWLMAAPGFLEHNAAGTDNGHIVGPVITTFAIIACWECTRTVRKWNFPLGAWLLLAPWLLGYEDGLAIASDMMCGAMVIALASVQGYLTKHYGGGWSALWQSKPHHWQEARKNS